MMRRWLVVAALLVAARAHAQDAGPPTEGQIEAGQLSKVPKQTKFVEAEYPAEAADKGIEAEVILLLDIDEKGFVTSVGIETPADPPGMGFDEAVLAVAPLWEFEPAEVDGKPLAVQISYRYRFTLKAAQPAPSTQPGAPGTQPAAPGIQPVPSTQPATPATQPARAPVENFGGVLRERGTRLPLAGVLVTVFRDAAEGEDAVGFEATSDAEGRFAFFDLEPGPWKVLADPPGYYPLRTTETIAAGERTSATYYLERGSYNPYDVTVTATHPRKEVSRTIIGAAELDKVPGGAGDPLAVVQNFAGVARTFGGLLVVRGSAPEDSRIFIEGVEIPLIYHFGGLKSVVPVGMLDSIEFYPGNFTPGYGRATGGIVDVQLKREMPKKIGGYADVSLLDTGLYLEIPIGDKASVALAGRRSYIDFVLALAVPDDAPVDLVTAPRYYDYQLLATYRPAPAHELRLFFFGSDDRLEVLFENPADVTADFDGSGFTASTSFVRGIASHRFVPSRSFENLARLSVGTDTLAFSGGSLLFNLDILSVQLRESARFRLGERVTLTAGADLLYNSIDALVSLPPGPKEGQPQTPFDLDDTITSEVNDLRIWSPALFAEAELTFGDLLVLPGVRADYFERVEKLAIQPRLTARWQVAPAVTVKGGAGLFMQEPTFDETDEGFGNPDLGVERALHLSAGVEVKPRKWLTLDATGFWKQLDDLVSPTDALRMEGGMAVPLRYDNGGEGKVYGVELTARHELAHNLSGWLSYTLSRAVRRDSGQSDDRLFDFDQTHILTLVASWQLPRNWTLGGRFRLVSGNPSTPVIGSVYDASADRYDPIYGLVNSSRVSAFHQLDLRLDRRWVYQGWMLTAYFDLQNVYNRANPEGVQYNYDFSLSKPASGLPIVTIFGLRAEL